MRFKHFVSLFTGFFCIAASLFAQNGNLYIPLEIQQAYANGTRSPNGTPGPNYWQNGSDYQIRVTLEPATRTVRGQESVTYNNNSPDTLRELVIRLYPDIFKKGAIRDEAVDPGDVTDGVNVGAISVNGSKLDLQAGRPLVRRTGTNLFITLSRPLMPKSKLNLEISWDYTIPAKTHIREGTYGENTFFVAYWYPQIAVYDDVHGWDVMNYTGTQEFYNDFSNFDVEITVPKDFLVWATGTWQNPAEVLTGEYLKRYQRATQTDEIVHVVEAKDLRQGGITANKPQNVWKYRAENVPDFAFALSNRYLWDATSTVVDATSGRRTTVGAAYDPKSEDFTQVARFGRESVAYFSTQMPGVPFPYPNLTVFNGSGGMEFPMMVNDGSMGTNLEEAAEVTAHEIAHTYFPFYMGINERRYAWMDEGWASFLPNRIPFRKSAADAQTFTVQRTNAAYLSMYAGKEEEMPMMTPTNLLTGFSYGFATYFRPAVAYATLEEVLGRDKFKGVLQEYMRRWNGKHPMPYDFFYSFNAAAGEDLTWFWRPWFFEKGYPDLALRVTPEGNGTKVVVERKGSLPVPVHLQVTYADGTVETYAETARVWKDGAAEFAVEKTFTKPVRTVTLGDSQVPDANPRDNTYAR
jgi:hypothetical protein